MAAKRPWATVVDLEILLEGWDMEENRAAARGGIRILAPHKRHPIALHTHAEILTQPKLADNSAPVPNNFQNQANYRC